MTATDLPSTPVPSTVPATAPETRGRGRWLAPLAVVVALVVWNVAAWAIDLSPLRQPEYSWGFSFATTVYSVLVGLPLLGLTLLASAVARLVPSVVRPALVVGAGLCALGAAALVLMTVVVVLTEGVGRPADVLFAVASLATAACLAVPALRGTRA